ncbi:hypothetical protein [Planobispora rosea]|uniref:hypothetical protein n=1 Tax=Planobispora rosea TaxID=35762 RepID=UPI00114D192D|nr:hypothetical protein [Planobispora rosea]
MGHRTQRHLTRTGSKISEGARRMAAPSCASRAVVRARYTGEVFGDTPCGRNATQAQMRKDPSMPSVAGRGRRAAGTGGRASIATKVPQWLKDQYDAAAQRRGMSLSRYLEELIKLDPLVPARETDTQSVEQLSA